MSQGFTSSAASRFLRYVTFDTQSDDASGTYPSTDKQLVLLNVLAGELRRRLASPTRRSTSTAT
jgi:tripeptide aminopeptidase